MPAPESPVPLNLVVLRGVTSVPPETRKLASGSHLLTLSLRVPGPGSSATSVPVAVWDPPAWLEDVGEDEPLVVLGQLQRRFFRTGAGTTGSRVEVVAALVGRGGERRRLAAIDRRARQALDELA